MGSKTKVKMKLNEIINAIDEKSFEFNIGKLQNIRKDLKSLNIRADKKIFNLNRGRDSDDSVSHYGGKNELQFNIAFEDINDDENFLRYGVAFQILQNISELYRKILKLNTIIYKNPQRFKNYEMWTRKNEKRVTEFSKVKEIGEELMQNGNFVFIGKRKKVDSNALIHSVLINDILKTFDDLLEIYIEVESKDSPQKSSQTKQNCFSFSNRKSTSRNNSEYNAIQKQINVEARHSLLQEALVKSLSDTYGEDNVGTENSIHGQRIDVVLKQDDLYTFYEIKTANTAKQCVREALGQIFEYAYYDCQKYADKIVVAGEHNLDEKTEAYLNFLNLEFSLPIEYLKIKISS